jgi:hypothetical protein
MTVTTRYASIEDMKLLMANRHQEGLTLAVGQINAILARPHESRATELRP